VSHLLENYKSISKYFTVDSEKQNPKQSDILNKKYFKNQSQQYYQKYSKTAFVPFNKCGVPGSMSPNFPP
jgi:hypothetical protein